MELFRIVYIVALLIISLYLVIYSYLYIRTSQNATTLVGTHIHPLIHRFIEITILLSILVGVGSLILLLKALLTLL